MSRSHVRHGSDFMRYAAEKAPAGATNQTQGVLNTRGRFGSRRRSTRIPPDTITNASSVPIETRLAASRIGRIAPKKGTMPPGTRGGREGGRDMGGTLFTKGGRSPPRATREKTRRR